MENIEYKIDKEDAKLRFASRISINILCRLKILNTQDQFGLLFCGNW